MRRQTMNLTNEASAVVLQKMLEEGKITEEEIERIASEFPSDTLCQSVDIIHGLICTDDNCDYGREESECDNPWMEHHHRRWLNIMRDFMDERCIGETELFPAIEGFKNLYNAYELNRDSGGSALFDLWREGL